MKLRDTLKTPINVRRKTTQKNIDQRVFEINECGQLQKSVNLKEHYNS